MLTTGAHRQGIVLLALLVLAAPGCSPMRNTVPPQAVTPTFFDAPRASRKPIDFTRLRQEPPPVYLLGPRDTLGIFIEGILGKSEDAPPVHFSERSNVPPAIGYPIPIREDGTLSLPYALSETGGLPGVDAKCQVKILRSGMKNREIQSLLPRASDDPAARSQLLASSANVIRIPLRVSPNDPVVTFSPEDIILQNGDILFVESRDSEVFYTGGLLQGHQFPIPRDYDLDVLGAIAMAGGSISASAGGGQTSNNRGGGGGVGSIFPPTRITVVRTVGKHMVPIKINLKTAMTNPAERILIQPNDLILLEYTDFEVVLNVLLSTLNLNLSVNPIVSR
jgi:hypothetical protein